MPVNFIDCEKEQILPMDPRIEREQNSVSGVVLCLNEECNLERSLKSLSWCDEVVVVDSGSSDNSVSVAKRCGARVVEKQRTGQFIVSEQRNWAIDHCNLKGQWVLFLDADEEIGHSCKMDILTTISCTSAADAYEMTPRFWFLGRWLKRTQGYPNWHPRLLKKGSITFEGGVWECFTKTGNIGRIKTPYEHYAFSKGIEDWLERHQRYANWEAKKICDYLETGNKNLLGTRRWLRLRRLTAQFWPLRPLLRFIQKFILQGGYTEGWQGFVFSLLMSGYDLITVIKVIEYRRQRKGLAL